MIRIAVRSLRQGKMVLSSSLVLVGMGLDAIGKICTSPGASCRVQGSSTDLAAQLQSSFVEGQPLPSMSQALLIDSLKFVPLGVIRAVFQHADEKSFVRQMEGVSL